MLWYYLFPCVMLQGTLKVSYFYTFKISFVALLFVQNILYILLILFSYLCSLQILVLNACSVLIVHKLIQIYLSLSALETDVKLSSYTSEKNMKYNWYCESSFKKKKTDTWIFRRCHLNIVLSQYIVFLFMFGILWTLKLCFVLLDVDNEMK